MTKLLFLLTFLFAVGGGMLEGELLSLIRKSPNRPKRSNWAHGVTGALIGWLFGLALPTIPEYRPFFALFTSLYGAGIYLFLHLFFTKKFVGTTRVKRHPL